MVLDVCPKYRVLLNVLTLTGCLVFVMYTSVAIVTFSILEGSIVRVEIGWPIRMIIPTRLKEGSEKTPESVDVAGPGALGNRGVN